MTDPVCVKCHKLHDPTKCQGHKSSEPNRGEQCTNWPMHGQRHCRKHGGASPQAKAKAVERLTWDKAREQMSTYGVPVEVPVEDGLLSLLAHTAGHIEYLVGIIRCMDPTALVWGVTAREAKRGIDAGKRTAYASETQGAGMSMWMQLYFQERKFYLECLKTAFAVKLEERRLDQATEVAKVQASGLAAMVNAITTDPELSAMLSAEAKDAVRMAVSRKFRDLAAAA